jgi:hypothetical protein
MIFDDVLMTYFGWCPKFNVPLLKSAQNPIAYLSLISKVMLVTFLAAWGLRNVASYPFVFYEVERLKMLLIFEPQIAAALLTMF